MAGGEFSMAILGRTIEHLGSQMYKHRAPSIAELVANCWDAGAKTVWITVPDSGKQSMNAIVIMDDGEGMDSSVIQDRYLKVGLNRRRFDGGISHERKVMGRKGIGKLAGFGLAEKVTVKTWTSEVPKAIQFSMSLHQLKQDSGETGPIKFPWTEVDKASTWPKSGTRIELSELRHTTPLDIASLEETLARRFSRTTLGEMKIYVNDSILPEPVIDSMHDFPDDNRYSDAELPSGRKIKYRYSFAKKPLRSKELQGFVIYANERTAQAPPFFFDVEATASAQHSTRYVTGEIVADFLDEGVDDESDVVSTDRQELDWEKQELREIQNWGEALARRVLRECAELRGQRVENWILTDAEFKTRLDLLDPHTRKEIGRFLKILGQKSEENDERTRELADSLIRAYEFRTFHDVIDDIEKVGDDPEKLNEILERLHDWKVLESRAILEIVKGRLSIINRLEKMIIQDVPETASGKTNDNLHDLLAEYPWLFNPEWQVYTEEKTIGRQLREWGEKYCLDDMKNKRVDFLAFEKYTDALVIIEMKRPSHAVELDEIQRLEQYQVAFMGTRRNCKRVLVYGGGTNIPQLKWNAMQGASDFEVLTWQEMFNRAKTFYSHYEAVLGGDVTAEGFRRKQTEVARTREIISEGSAHRSAEDRERGVGNSDP